MEPRAKKIATIIIGGSGNSGSSNNDYDREAMNSDALLSASKSVLKSIKSDDPKMLIESIKTLMSCIGDDEGERE
jgi:hypothetical protein